jgi:hypothetical protein
LALIATIFRATIATILGKIISQAKWAWYSESRARPLEHFQDFDDGSHGVLGAALLIPKVLRHNFVPALAALVLIASLAIGSFVQQAIRTKGCSHQVTGDIASIPNAHYVPRQAIINRGEAVKTFGTLDDDMNFAVYGSLIAPEGRDNQIIPGCTTGNCTFPTGDPVDRNASNITEGNLVTFSTVGLCRSCIEVSPLAEPINATSDNYSVPYGLPNG